MTAMWSSRNWLQKISLGLGTLILVSFAITKYKKSAGEASEKKVQVSRLFGKGEISANSDQVSLAKKGKNTTVSEALCRSQGMSKKKSQVWAVRCVAKFPWMQRTMTR